MYLFKQQKII